MPKLSSLVAALALFTAVGTQAAVLDPQLGGMAFLVGHWASGQGHVADTGGTSRGYSTITPEAGGAVLLRRDHTDLLSASGRPAGSFEQIMMIYPEGETVHADYADGTHIIHYVSAKILPGRSVTFSSEPRPGEPRFRLRYDLTAPKTLAVAFEMAPPGSLDFHPIASGRLTRAR